MYLHVYFLQLDSLFMEHVFIYFRILIDLLTTGGLFLCTDMTARKRIAGWRQLRTAGCQFPTADVRVSLCENKVFISKCRLPASVRLFEVSIGLCNKIKLVQRDYLTSVKSC